MEINPRKLINFHYKKFGIYFILKIFNNKKKKKEKKQVKMSISDFRI